MTDDKPVPAAQYLRMSTEHQQYSLENQSAAIHTYAESHGLEVVRTYSDAARSGVVLNAESGFASSWKMSSKATLDIWQFLSTMWGRFQDTDESAHYEFLCKSPGVPVRYCAETFANDGTLPSLIMKALKRTMAGEYSRELGVKVFAGQKHLTLLGFKTGGRPGNGLRRMLVSASGVPKHELAPGEQKIIATDRVIQVAGPAHEVQIVREIYRMFISEKRSACYIARKLNSDGVPRPGSSKWDHYVVRDIVTNPKYAGWAVFGRATRKLHTAQVKLPKSEWVVKPDAFEPVVDAETFAKAQKVRQEQTLGSTDEKLLDGLRAVLTSQGKLCRDIILDVADIASPSTYR